MYSCCLKRSIHTAHLVFAARLIYQFHAQYLNVTRKLEPWFSLRWSGRRASRPVNATLPVNNSQFSGRTRHSNLAGYYYARRPHGWSSWVFHDLRGAGLGEIYVYVFFSLFFFFFLLVNLWLRCVTDNKSFCFSFSSGALAIGCCVSFYSCWEVLQLSLVSAVREPRVCIVLHCF